MIGEADRLPTFIFCRDREVEEAHGYRLAGRLITDAPKCEQTEEETREIVNVSRELLEAVRRDPRAVEFGLWRNGRPPDALLSPYPGAAMMARIDRCLVVTVRVAPHPRRRQLSFLAALFRLVRDILDVRFGAPSFEDKGVQLRLL
jgi:hypothetical protein